MEITGWDFPTIDALSYLERMKIFVLNDELTRHRIEQQKKARRG